MKFTALRLNHIAEAVRSLSETARVRLSTMLHRRQPEFCEIIDEVGLDYRCLAAHRFCTSFCAIALRHAEQVTRRSAPIYKGTTIHELAGLVRRGEQTRIGKRACGYRKSIRRHALTNMGFDEDDTAWLCTIISAFLFLIEETVGAFNRRIRASGHRHKVAE